MKHRSLIPHMTLEQLTLLRDGLYDAQRHAMRAWGLSLTRDQITELTLCLTQWQDGRTTVDQVRGQLESDAYQQLAGVGVQPSREAA